MSNLKQLAIRGGIWTLLGFGGSQVVRLGSNIILTRLLSPELFGLMLLSNTIYIGLHLFSDFGLGVNVIRSSRSDDPLFLNTIWTIQVIRGFALWLIACIVTLPFANFYGDQRLLFILPVISFTAVIGGFQSTSRYTFNRELKQKPLILIDFTTQVLSAVLMVSWAWLSPSIWALIAGNVFASILQLVWSFRLEPDKPNHFAWDPSAVKEIFEVGQWILITTMINFLGLQTDRLTLGKIFSLELLGIYSVAASISEVPWGVIGNLTSSIIFPVMSKFADLTRSEFRQKILKNRWPLLLVVAVGIALSVTYGDLLIQFLYRGKYTKAAWMLPCLLVGIWPRVLYATMDKALLVIGQTQYSAVSAAAKTLTNLLGIPFAYGLWGALGAIIVVTLNDVLYYLVILVGLWRNGLSCWWQDLWTTLFFLVFLGGMIEVRVLLGLGIPGMASFASSHF